MSLLAPTSTDLPPGRPDRPRRPVVLPALAVVGAVVLGALGFQSLGAPVPVTGVRVVGVAAVAPRGGAARSGPPLGRPGDPSDGLGVADGAVPDG